MPQQFTTAFIIIIVVMMVFFALLAGAFIVFIVFVGRKLGASRKREMEQYVEEWAEEEGYQLVEIREERIQDSPFVDRRPRRVGIVRGIAVKDRRGRLHRGWVFFPARLGPRGYSGLRLEDMEVEWENGPA